ncbi:cold-shock protein, partial [Nocardia brasiliensis]|uniref:cold-shock protein n=1 Tax=Nocardia brasiliensis TaxID=37326 RepID=UPI003D78889D
MCLRYSHRGRLVGTRVPHPCRARSFRKEKRICSWRCATAGSVDQCARAVGVRVFDDERVSAVPTGRVKWYDVEKGFGFLSQDEGEDVYVRSSARREWGGVINTRAAGAFGICAGGGG